MSVSIGYVEIRNIDETDVLEVDNGAGGKLYLTWSTATPLRKARDQRRYEDLLDALHLVAKRRGLERP